MPNRTGSKKKIDKAIVVAIIGLVGATIAALFASPVLVAIVQKTSPAVMATATSTTSAPIPTATFIPTSTFTLTPKQDFSSDCINSTDWTPSPESISFTKENNCWDLSSYGIAAQDSNLSFVIKNDIPQAGSLYTPIPEKGIVKFTVKIDKFISGKTNGNLVFGVGTVNDWLTEGEFLFFRATDSGYYLVYGNSVLEVGKRTIDSYKIGSDIVVGFHFNKLAFDIYINNTKIVSDIPLSASSPQVFWVGYRLPEKSNLVASISGFSIEK